jgi:hypothetical protein
MPHSHNGQGHAHAHGHSHGPELSGDRGKADFWTRFNQVGEYIESSTDVLVYSIGLANIVNAVIEYSRGQDINQPTSDTYKYSVTVVSILLALTLSIGAAYCHGILNQQFQDPIEEDCEEDHEEEHHHEQPPADNTIPLLDAEEKEPVDAELDTAVAQKNRDYSLNRRQKFFILADALCHGVGRAGALMAVTDYVIAFNSGAVSTPTVKLITQCVSTLFGMGFSVAEVRTCKNSLLLHNKEQLKAEDAANTIANRR